MSTARLRPRTRLCLPGVCLLLINNGTHTDTHRFTRTGAHLSPRTPVPKDRHPRPAPLPGRTGEEDAEGRRGSLTSPVHGADTHRHLHFGVPHPADPAFPAPSSLPGFRLPRESRRGEERRGGRRRVGPMPAGLQLPACIAQRHAPSAPGGPPRCALGDVVLCAVPSLLTKQAG